MFDVCTVDDLHNKSMDFVNMLRAACFFRGGKKEGSAGKECTNISVLLFSYHFSPVSLLD